MNAATILKFKGNGVVTATANTSLLEIANLLAQYRIGCIVIVGDDDKVAGIMLEHGLMRAICKAGPQVLDKPVSDFMTTAVVTARETDTYDRRMSEMTTHRFRHTCGRDGPSDWYRLHRRPGQDARRGCRV